MPELNEKQIRFCDEYLIDYNGTQAAIRAGYSKRTARVQASDLLTKPDIQTYLNLKRQKIASKLEVSQERIVEELAKIGYADITDFLEVDEVEIKKKIRGKMQIFKGTVVRIIPTKNIPKEKIGAIASIEQGKEGIKLRTHDKVRALELLGKHTGIFEKDNKQKEPAVVQAPFSDVQVDKIISSLRENKGS